MSKKPRNPKSFKRESIYIPNQKSPDWEEDPFGIQYNEQRKEQKRLSKRKLAKR